MTRRFLALFLVAFLLSLITNHYSLITVSAHQTVTIDMTPDGFTPQDVTLDENSYLTFINKDIEDHWPASDPHPIHDNYSEFDPQKALKPDEFWVFKSKKVGTWKFHDHLNPHHKGTLMVTSESGADSLKPSAPVLAESGSAGEGGLLHQILSFFKNLFAAKPEKSALQTQFKSLTKDEFQKLPPKDQYNYLAELATKNSAKSAWDYLTTIYKGESGTQGNIHDLAHFAGNLFFKHAGFAGLSKCSPIFAFGCYHGFLDAAFATNLDHVKDAETACNTLGPIGSGPVASCIHGIGHGIASFYQVQDLTKSLATCNQLQANQQFCYDGVFMEFARAAPDAFYKAEEPLYPCTKLPKELAFACGRNQPSVLMQRFHKTFAQIATTCINQTNRDLRDACIDALGFISVNTTQGNTDQIVTQCHQITVTTFQNRCLIAAAGELVFQNVTGWQESSPKICSSIRLVKDRANCTQHLNQLIQEYHRDKDAYVRDHMAACFKQGGHNDCYKQLAATISQETTLKQSLDLLHKNEDHPEIYSRCHELTHYLSRNEYAKTHSIPAVYAQCDSTCHGGCYHGALEEYLKEQNLNPTSVELAHQFSALCEQVKDPTHPLIYYECMHGLGHAAMYVTDMELHQSLTLCDQLRDQGSQERCYSGVFMENSSSSTNLDHPSKYIKAENPLYPCDSLDDQYQQLCYRYQSSYFAILTQQNWSQTADLCLKVPQKYQDDCFRTIGTNQVGFTQDFKVMSQDCTTLPTTHFQEVCVSGVVSSLAYRFVGDAQKMIDFCSQVNATYQPTCFRQIGTSLKDWSTDQAEATKLCQKIPNPKHSSWCLSSAQVS